MEILKLHNEFPELELKNNNIFCSFKVFKANGYIYNEIVKRYINHKGAKTLKSEEMVFNSLRKLELLYTIQHMHICMNTDLKIVVIENDLIDGKV